MKLQLGTQVWWDSEVDWSTECNGGADGEGEKEEAIVERYCSFTCTTWVHSYSRTVQLHVVIFGEEIRGRNTLLLACYALWHATKKRFLWQSSKLSILDGVWVQVEVEDKSTSEQMSKSGPPKKEWMYFESVGAVLLKQRTQKDQKTLWGCNLTNLRTSCRNHQPLNHHKKVQVADWVRLNCGLANCFAFYNFLLFAP